MLNEVKLLVFDLDGTLLNSDKNITIETKKEIQRASKQGIKICLASGRFEKMMYLEKNILDCVDYMISSNGAQICDFKNNIIYKNSLNKNDFINVFELIKEHGYKAMIYSSDSAYYPIGVDKMLNKIENYKNKLALNGFDVDFPAYAYDDISDFYDLNDISKAVIYEDISNLKEFINQYLLDFNITFEPTGYGLLGIFNEGVSKFTALEEIKSILGLNSNQVAIFGDYDNDLSMFACSNYCIAMKNGSELVKKSANYITKYTNDEDGVAIFIRENIIGDTQKS